MVLEQFCGTEAGAPAGGGGLEPHGDVAGGIVEHAFVTHREGWEDGQWPSGVADEERG